MVDALRSLHSFPGIPLWKEVNEEVVQHFGRETKVLRCNLLYHLISKINMESQNR